MLGFNDFNLEDASRNKEDILSEIHKIEAEITKKNEEIKLLLETSKALKSELAKYYELVIPPLILNEPRLDMYSSTSDKVAVYWEYFGGRRDVYARRVWNKNRAKVEYYPNCLNRWDKSKCLIGQTAKSNPCFSCINKRYAYLSDETIKNDHFRNADVLGINAIGMYAMRPDNTCSFIAIDLDEGSFEEDAKAILIVAREAGFPMVAERSFSGKGIHLWLFFSSFIKAEKAREFAFLLLDNASIRFHSISFKSYDRVFPTQDSLSNGGLGNLILLPFVGSAVKRKCTIFLDDKLNPIKEQFAFLSSIPKCSESDVNAYINAQSALYGDFFNSEDVEFLWKRKLPTLDVKDSKNEKLILHLGSGITISKTSVSKKMLLFLRRMASFSNVQYYKLKNQYHGKAPLNINSTIECYVENNNVMWLPRAFQDPLTKSLDNARIRYEFKNHRVCSPQLNVSFLGKLRRRQLDALDALLQHENGILNAATGFGKTVVALALIARLKQRALIIVDSTQLLNQWKEQISKFLLIKDEVTPDRLKRNNKDGVGILGNQKDSRTGLVDIAMVKTLCLKCEEWRPDWIDEYGVVIVDECHHVAAKTFKTVLENIRSKYVYGLSATAKRKDGDEKLIFAYCGQIVFQITPEQMARDNNIVQHLIPRFTMAKLSSRRIMQMDALKELISNKSRNEMIISDIESAYSAGGRILVLSELVEHTATIGNMLEDQNIPNIVVTGQTTTRELRESMSKINQGIENLVIVATSRFMGEGIDIPYLNTLFLTTPSSFEGITTQQAGRIARKVEGKSDVYIYDYVDYNVDYFKNMYLKRMRTYNKLGYVIDRDDYNKDFFYSSFYKQDRFLPCVKTSIDNAHSSIFIMTPIITLSAITKEIIDALKRAKLNGIHVEIYVDEPRSDYKNQFDSASKLLTQAELDFNIAKCISSCIVIDSEEIWFGDISLLAMNNKQTSDRYMMHFYDSKVASEIKDFPGSFVQSLL